MLVSIIIPSLNNLEKLKDCISRIKDQTFDNYEVWIIDGNSSDGTKNYLQTLKNPFMWISRLDKGVYDAMNQGILRSKGKWLYFLGSDDKLYSKNTLAEVFKDQVSVNQKMIIGKIKYNYKKSDSFLLKKNDGIVKPSWTNQLWINNTLPHQSIFYNKELFIDKEYSLGYKILADYAFNLHLFKKRNKVKIIDKIISICNTEGLSKNYNWKLYKEEIRIKTNESSLIYKPVFVLLALTKYLLKSIKL